VKIKVMVGQEVNVDPYKVMEQFIEDSDIRAEFKMEGIKGNIAKLLMSVCKISKRNGVIVKYEILDA
jgi:hypothetical protein